MANYDDIFNASAQKDTEDKSFVSFNKEEWAAQKKQERESAFAMIDETAQRMANDGGLFQSYLDVQARFDRYSVGNAVLITAQKADATQLSDFKGWKNNGVFIKKGESGIVLLEPGEEYTKEDGTVGVSYNSKKVFDISQTTAKVKDRPAMKRDERLLLKAIIHNAPCPIEISQKLPGEHQRGISSRRPRKSMLDLGWRPVTFFAAFLRSLLTRIWTTAHISAATMPLPPTACRMCSAAGTMCRRICFDLTDFPKDSLRWMPAV